MKRRFESPSRLLELLGVVVLMMVILAPSEMRFSSAQDDEDLTNATICAENGPSNCSGLNCTLCGNCTDGIKNNNETGVDCGGPCTRCNTTGTCTDGIQNNGEVGIDCGGNCSACTCDDGRQDNGETGVDCGGPFCPACPDTNPCKLDRSYDFAWSFVFLEQMGTPICVLINATNATKALYYPQVDVYSLLDLPRSFNSSVLGGTNTSVNLFTQITIQVGQAISPARYYSWEDPSTQQQYVAAFMTFIITVDSGTPTEINWDSGCLGCDDVDCSSQGQCGTKLQDCDANGGSINCDLKLYAAWTGTDDRGRFLASSGMVLSQFRDYSLQSAYENAAKTTTSTYPQFSSQGTA